MDHVGTGVELGHDLAAEPHSTEVPGHDCQVGGAGAQKGGIEPVTTLQHRGRPREPRAGELRREETAVGRPARMEPLGPGAVGEELEEATRHAAGEAHGLGGARRRETAQPGGDGGGDQRADHPRGVEAARVEAAAGRRAEPGGPLVAHRDRSQDGRPVRPHRLAGRERRRHDEAPGMDDGTGQRVVEVERVRQRPVGQRGPGGRQPLTGCHQRALRPAAVATGQVERGPAGRLVDGRQHDAQRVEQPAAHRGLVVGRQFRPAHPAAPFRQLARERLHHRSPPSTFRTGRPAWPSAPAACATWPRSSPTPASAAPSSCAAPRWPGARSCPASRRPSPAWPSRSTAASSATPRWPASGPPPTRLAATRPTASSASAAGAPSTRPSAPPSGWPPAATPLPTRSVTTRRAPRRGARCRPTLPHVAVPTTAGSSSEVMPGAGYRDVAGGRRVLFRTRGSSRAPPSSIRSWPCTPVRPSPPPAG